MIRSFENRAAQRITGFQSPAADYLEGRLDLSKKLIVDPHCTFYFQMKGEEMASLSIHHDDLLIIDRSLQPAHGAIVIAFYNGVFTCRMYQHDKTKPNLKNDSDTIEQSSMENLQIWGVVTAVCRNLLPQTLKRGRYKDVCTL
ncbi:LexA family protein [Pedobacter aquatilis]|uniref:LexA family protein n=1 Tax=Pedobacter aquatilis TaxID=351343 RepID=UPI00292EE4C8|nr:S24 family peptidase [Pedobacter aquatilis]